MLSAFSLHQPATVEEASEMLRHFGDDAAVYAGGTELLVLMKERLAHFSHLVDIKRIAGMSGIRVDEENNELVIGALTTHRAIETSSLVRERAPLLAEVEAQVANIRVRHAGTIGGNLCFAEPHSDPATLFVAWEASFTLSSDAGSRTVAAADFFTGLLETAREPHELLTTIRFPIPRTRVAIHNRHAERSEASPAGAERGRETEREVLRYAQQDPLSGSGSAYQRFKTHERPAAAVAAALDIDGGRIRNARVVAGSVGIGPERLSEAEDMLIGQRSDPALFSAAGTSAAANVYIEEEGFESSGYRRHLIEVLTSKALTQAAGRAA